MLLLGSDELWVYDQICLSMKFIWVSLISYMHDCYSLIFLLQIFGLVRPTGLIFLVMGEVLCNGFDLAVLDPSDKRGHDTYCIVAIKGKNKGFIHTWVYFIYIMSSCLRHYSVLYELNTLDACWIAVDVWSNSSRCRIVSVYLSRTWCLYMIISLDIIIIICFSINCPTVICLPTVEYLCSWEKPLVKPMAPRSIFYHICFQSTFILYKIIKIPCCTFYLFNYFLFLFNLSIKHHTI